MYLRRFRYEAIPKEAQEHAQKDTEHMPKYIRSKSSTKRCLKT